MIRGGPGPLGPPRATPMCNGLLFLLHGQRISPQNQKEDTIPKFAICNLPRSTFCSLFSYQRLYNYNIPPVTLPETSAASSHSCCNSEFEDEPNTTCPHFIIRQELNDLVRDLNLPKSKIECHE